LPDGVFNGLGRLRRLTLSHNKLSSLLVDVLKGLGSLRLIDLSNNPLSEKEKAEIKEKLPSTTKIFW